MPMHFLLVATGLVAANAFVPPPTQLARKQSFSDGVGVALCRHCAPFRCRVCTVLSRHSTLEARESANTGSDIRNRAARARAGTCRHRQRRTPARRARVVAAASKFWISRPSYTLTHRLGWVWYGNVSSGTNASKGAVCARREAAPCAQSGGRGWQGRRWRCAPGGAHACRAASPYVLCVLCVLRVLRGLCGLSVVAGWGSAGCAGSAAVRVCTVGGPRTRTRGASWCVAHSNQPRPLQRSRGQRRHGRVRRPSAGRGGPRGGAGARSAREPLGVIRGGCGGEGGKRPLRPAQGQGWGEEGQG
jgi:hypothetical protein